MTLQQLEYIVALDTYRHFVTAAEHCRVTQPTLTMQVQKLEEEMGVKIFDRATHPLKPTAVGELILIKARQILHEVAQLKALVSTETESVRGEFTIGVIPTVAPYLLPLLIPYFVSNNPHTKLKIVELQTKDIIHRLSHGTLDVGILATPLDDRNIREIVLYYEPFLLYLPPNHVWTHKTNISHDLLKTDDMLFLSDGHCFREQALSICNKSNDVRSKQFDYESGSFESLKRLVLQGVGYTLVPELALLDELQQQHIKRFKSPEPVREISIVVHKTFTREAFIERLHAAILAVVPDRFKKIKKYTRVKWR